VILPDSSAWVEYFRASGSPVHGAMARALSEDVDVVTTGIVVMELLAGETSETDVAATRSLLLEYPLVPVHAAHDFEHAAKIYRSCRAAGDTVRQLTDCLIAVAAIKAGASLLHADRDFDTIARHSDLRIELLA
jgi:predicted nucleic acid-binding protein